MSVLPDKWIRLMAKKHAMIEPFAEGKPRKGRISYGTSSYGYDFRLAGEFKVPVHSGEACLDPKSVQNLKFQDTTGKSCIIPPRSYILGRSLEYMRIPRDILVLCQGKSTYARCGVIVNVTPLEPEWQGYITLSLVNAGPLPVRIYANEGIGQMVFFRAESECIISYADRKGKYQAQQNIQVARV